MRDPRGDDRETASQAQEGEGFVVGVDGGGSGSRALLMDLSGKELGSAQGPPALVDPFNLDAVIETLAATVREAVGKAGLETPARSLWAGLAGAGRAETQATVEAALGSQGLADQIHVGMDLEGAHQDAFGSGPGVVLSVGTGTMAWGRDPDRNQLRVGGWGSYLGEEGSGYWLGMEGLRAVARASDGRGSPTLLTSSLLETLGLPHPHGLVVWVPGASKAEVAALAPLVLEAADRGDDAALAIRGAGLAALEKHLEVFREAWVPWGVSFPLALSGGLLTGAGPLKGEVEAIGEKLGGILHPTPVNPVRGAAELALTLTA